VARTVGHRSAADVLLATLLLRDSTLPDPVSEQPPNQPLAEAVRSLMAVRRQATNTSLRSGYGSVTASDMHVVVLALPSAARQRIRGANERIIGQRPCLKSTAVIWRNGIRWVHTPVQTTTSESARVTPERAKPTARLSETTTNAIPRQRIVQPSAMAMATIPGALIPARPSSLLRLG
jgi:hypothetical protein